MRRATPAIVICWSCKRPCFSSDEDCDAPAYLWIKLALDSSTDVYELIDQMTDFYEHAYLPPSTSNGLIVDFTSFRVTVGSYVAVRTVEKGDAPERISWLRACVVGKFLLLKARPFLLFISEPKRYCLS